MKALKIGSLALLLAVPAVSSAADLRPLYQGDFRIQQSDISSLTRNELRLVGMRMFTNPLLKADGFGDGNKPNPDGTQGNRGTLQGNGAFQRIGGLDGQMCLECHTVISRRTVPMRLGIGGVGGINATVLGAGGNTFVDLDLKGRSLDSTSGVTLPQANIDGRVINPPFIFGAGGIELLANEMTEQLHHQLATGATNGVTPTYLRSKGVSFGHVIKGADNADGSINIIVNNAEGTANLTPGEEDFMVVQPFGRKGNEKSTRTFDIGALSFHFGMGVVTSQEDADLVKEQHGVDIEVTTYTDHDSDGVHNEVTQGELSALSAFVASAQTPFQTAINASARNGRKLMNDAGCTVCHKPKMQTKSPLLGLRFPEVANEPSANVYTTLDMRRAPMNFAENARGGITVPLFADLKRHYMGPTMEEFNGDGMFTTMRLWGVADTAPYLHDGRALTITEAIEMHGADVESEAHTAVQAFKLLADASKQDILNFLDTLRSPPGTFDGLLNLSDKVAAEQGTE